MVNSNENVNMSTTEKYSPSIISHGNEKSTAVSEIIIKEYSKRWIMLGLFSFYWGLSTFQWIEYSIISNIVSKYYGVSLLAVDWTSMSFMMFFVIFVIPGSYVADRINLRRTAILGTFLICLGSWIKVFSVDPNGFTITFIGQSFVATSQAIILSVPGRLAAQWFPARQISKATSLAFFGNLLGCAMGFCITPMVVKNHEKLEDIGRDLSRLFWIIAIMSSVTFFSILLFFQDEPELPPSKTRALQKVNLVNNRTNFTQPMKRLFTNKSYLILCNSYGLNVGVLNAASTLLNQIYLSHYENGEEDAGRLGLIILITGMFGAVAFGAILDKYLKFKETTVMVYLLTLLGQIFFAIAMWLEIKWMIYLAATFVGFFMSGYLALGYEMCAEYTYPESELIATGILNIANNIYGIVLVILCGKLMEYYGDMAVHICLCSALFLGFILTVLTKDEQRRQDAKKSMYIGVLKIDTNEDIE